MKKESQNSKWMRFLAVRHKEINDEIANCKDQIRNINLRITRLEGARDELRALQGFIPTELQLTME